jgi:predicted PurR-regulated permease PerM
MLRKRVKRTFASARVTLVVIVAVFAGTVWVLRDLAVLVGYSVLLAYALLPAITAVERIPLPQGRRVPRGIVAGIVMLSVMAILVSAIVLAIPRLGVELAHLAASTPEVFAKIVQDLRSFGVERELSPWLDPALASLQAEAPRFLQDLGGTVAHGAAGVLGQVLIFALLPLLSFYLLAESDAVFLSVMRLAPEEARPEITRLGSAVGRTLQQYVRGQAIVCLVTAVAVGAGLAIAQHPAALVLALLAGVAELLPYLGFSLTALAIGLAGWSVSPFEAWFGVGIYVVLNWTIGTFIAPRVLGRQLRMHPFVVTVSVLAGAQVLGPAGALLALPVVAGLQAIIGELATVPDEELERSAPHPVTSAT